MKEPILILHGWGSLVTGEGRFGEVKKILEKKGYTVFTPDLPGFGSNPLKKEELFFEDYVEFVKEFIQKNKLKKVILIGHSFGGRIAIAFTAKYPEYVSKLILVSASGIPRKLSLKKEIAKSVAKVGKIIFTVPILHFLYQPMRHMLYKGIGEMDYYKAKNLEKTFKNVYRIDISKELPKIKVNTLIIWGADDMLTPLSDGKIMHEKIKGSKFVIIKHETHKFPYENPMLFCQNVLAFLH